LAQQLTFDLPVRRAYGRDDYLVSPSNENAVRQIERPQEWPLGRAVLVGEKGCGKTHLARVWQQTTGARFVQASALTLLSPDTLVEGRYLVVDGIEHLASEAAAERALFHVLNLAGAENVAVLLTANAAPSRLEIELADLKSRLKATQVFWLEPPDDRLLSAMLVKQFQDRQLAVSPRVISFLVPRMERTAAAAGYLVAELDARALSEKCAVTVRLAREALDKLAHTRA